MKKKRKIIKKKNSNIKYVHVVTSRAMCCTSVMYNKAKGDAILVMSLGEKMSLP